MDNKNVTIRIETQLKEDVEKLLDELGITLSGAITIFLKQAVGEQRIPFEITISPDRKPDVQRLLAYREKLLGKK